MIKPEELRIANFVFIDKALLNELADDLGEIIESEYFKVSLIDRMFCNVIINGKEVEFQLVDLKPIPLTEEWLVKFGFTQRRDSKWYELQYAIRGTYLLYGLGNYHTEICLGGSTTAQGPTKYVHQLQNLYFALTGEELTE